jgi:hypothetical protein
MPSHAVHPLARALARVSTDVLRDRCRRGPVFVGGGGDVDHGGVGGVGGATLTAVAESVDDTGWARSARRASDPDAYVRHAWWVRGTSGPWAHSLPTTAAVEAVARGPSPRRAFATRQGWSPTKAHERSPLRRRSGHKRWGRTERDPAYRPSVELGERHPWCCTAVRVGRGWRSTRTRWCRSRSTGRVGDRLSRGLGLDSAG